MPSKKTSNTIVEATVAVPLSARPLQARPSKGIPVRKKRAAKARRKCARARKETTAKAPPLVLSPVSGRHAGIGQEMRAIGLDARAIASAYGRVYEEVFADATAVSNVQKLRLDLLKELSRHVAPPERTGTGDAPVIVQLIHNVPRPERPQPRNELPPSEPPQSVVQ